MQQKALDVILLLKLCISNVKDTYSCSINKYYFLMNQYYFHSPDFCVRWELYQCGTEVAIPFAMNLTFSMLTMGESEICM